MIGLIAYLVEPGHPKSITNDIKFAATHPPEIYYASYLRQQWLGY